MADPLRLASGRTTPIETKASERMRKEPGKYFPGSFHCGATTCVDALEIHQVQTITPVALAQVLADCEWTALALQVCGGPATITAVMVTFCEGVKP